MRKEGRPVPIEYGIKRSESVMRLQGWASSPLPGGGADAFQSAKLYQGDTRCLGTQNQS